MLSFNISAKAAVKKLGNRAIKSMMKELIQLHQKKTWMPVNLRGPQKRWARKQVKKLLGKTIIGSKMFLKEKFDSMGNFEKLKARLVARGDMEDETLFKETSSPTVSLESALLVAAIAAKERRKVISLDVTGAYLNAEMGENEVFMNVPRPYSDYLVALDPEMYEPFLLPDGSIDVKLLRAMYGCTVSARLWYLVLSKFLTDKGFVPNPKDPCVFNRTTEDGKQVTAIIYVDDLLVTCVNQDELDKVYDELVAEFDTLTRTDGDVHSYLGMTFDFSKDGEVKVTMEKYIDDLLKHYDVKGKAATPAKEDVFKVDDTSEPLDDELRGEFHTVVAKLLYLTMRVRPDIMVAIIFLTGRVQVATAEDQIKLDRVLRYLNGCRHLGIVLRPTDGDMMVFTFVDASFAVHVGMVSQTGQFITLGLGPVFHKAGKQKLVSKSSCEAELVGQSDSVVQTIWTRDFLIHQGYEMGPATIYQDNTSAIALGQNGISNSDRTRHINIRYFFIKDRIDAGEIKMEYMPTKDMIADILTKPLQGEHFRRLRAKLLNWYED